MEEIRNPCSPVDAPHSLDAYKLAGILDSDLQSGLESGEALRRLERCGPNEIPTDKPRKRLRIFIDQFLNPVIFILAGAALLAYLFKEPWEGTAILVVIGISVGIGYAMESQAQRTLEALRKLGQSHITVKRSGGVREVRASEVVPGDLVLLSPGDIVPADIRLVSAEQLSLKEASLTGESMPCWKEEPALPADTPLVRRANMLFKGTTVLTGSGSGLVTAVGTSTELGKIQLLGIASKAPHTPLEKKLNALTIRLIWVTLVLSVLIGSIGYFRGAGLEEMIETAVALAVAAIPEGLPIVATIALARGMRALSKRQVIVKDLEAIQTLGATDLVLTDKTGTLTEDRLRVQFLQFGQEMKAHNDLTDSRIVNILRDETHPAFECLVRTAVLCNNEQRDESSHGDSLEMALLSFAQALGWEVRQTREAFPELWELPFDPARKLMVTVNRSQDGYFVHVKGAFEVLSGRCNRIMGRNGIQDFENKAVWDRAVAEMAATGLRVLCFACARHKRPPDPETVLDDLVFLGVIGFLDPPRKDVRPVFETYRKSGIRVVMVTGDHPRTAERVALETGLIGSAGAQEEIHTETRGLTDGVLSRAKVFARVLPEQKLTLVSCFQDRGHVVGMIGDGINDVPALKKSDIGIAMGIRGTEAAREAADVILKDDSFSAIELAIRQGRVVFANIRHFTVYLLSCNLAEMVVVAIAALGNLPAPLLPMQILFLNLVTDVFPALALGLGKGPKDIMERPPGNPRAPILNRADWSHIAGYGTGISAAVLGAVIYGDLVLGLPASRINNLGFLTLVIAQLVHVFNLAPARASFFRNEVVSNRYVWGALLISALMTAVASYIPVLSRVLELEPIRPQLLLLAGVFALGSVLLIQMMKGLLHRVFRQPRP